jgi:hypothetical protein
MPKNTACPGVPRVTDPPTNQEMAFAHLILSGTMNDRRAAEAVGLNPETAADIKSKPRVRAYIKEHRAAVGERLVDQEADLPRQAAGRAGEGLRMLNPGRDQILARLWELATLSHEATRGIIAGQIKALSMIVAIEGLIPDRRRSPSAAQPATPPVEPDIYASKWRREQEHQPMAEEPGDPVDAAKTPPAAFQVTEPAPNAANDTASPSLANSFIHPEKLNRVPEATGYVFDTVLNQANSLRLPFSRDRRFSGRRR